MKKEYLIDDEYTELAYQLVNTLDDLEDLRYADVRFCVFRSNEKKISNRRVIFGDCEKIKDKYKVFIPYDFIITVYEPNIEQLTDNQIKVLLWHELKHIGVEEIEGVVSYYTVPHDFEDFNSIYSQFGIDWNTEGKELPDLLKGSDA